jgi:hypothetical protein
MGAEMVFHQILEEILMGGTISVFRQIIGTSCNKKSKPYNKK